MKELIKTYCQEDWVAFQKAMKGENAEIGGAEEKMEE